MSGIDAPDLLSGEPEPELPPEPLPWNPEPSQAVVVRDPQDTPLAEAVNTPRGVMWYARIGVQSGMFKDLRDVAQAAAKILAGQEYGLGPFEAMRSIHIINGGTAFSAGYISSRIKASGVYDYRIVETTDEKCVLDWYQRGGVGAKDPNEWVKVGDSKFTKADAEKAKLWGRNTWASYPTDMLYNRALTRGARRHASAVFGTGAIYTPEELGAGVPDEDDGIAFGEAGGAG